MLHCFETSRWGKHLAVLVPRYIDKRSGNPIPAKLVDGGSVEVATTSGSLLPTWVFQDHGYFVDDLFIDGVDYEYSLRLRSRGYRSENMTRRPSFFTLPAPETCQISRPPYFTDHQLQCIAALLSEREAKMSGSVGAIGADFRAFASGYFFPSALRITSRYCSRRTTSGRSCTHALAALQTDSAREWARETDFEPLQSDPNSFRAK